MDNNEGTPDAEVQEQDSEENPDQRFEDQKKRAEKAEAEAKALREQLDSLQPEEEEEEPEKLPTQESKIQFDDLADNLSVLKSLEDDEVNELRSQAKDLGVDPIKFAQSNSWKSHLDSFRSNKSADSKTPEPSHRVAVFEGKTFADVVHDENAPQEQRQSAFEAQRDSLLKRGVNQTI